MLEDGDHKIVCVDSTTQGQVKKWGDIPLQERDLLLKYFGYKSKITTIEDAAKAIEHIKRNQVIKDR